MESEKNQKGHQLLESSESGDLEMVNFLVEKEKVDINIQNEFGYTPLHHAGRNGHTSIAQYLVSKCASINIEATPDYPITPLVCAVRYGHVDIAEILIKQGASTGIILDGNNLMFEAISSNKAEMIDLLLRNSFALDQYDCDGDTPLMEAISLQKYIAASFLLDKGSDYRKFCFVSGSSPLHCAMSGKDHPDNVKIIMLLLKHVKKVEGNVGLVSYVNHSDFKGRSALHRACYLRNYHAVRLLLNHGADPIIKDADGKTPLDLIHRLDDTHYAKRIRLLFQND